METKLHKSISELLDTQDPVFPEVSYTEEELVIADVSKKAGNYLKAPLVAEKGISANLLVAVEKLFDCDLSGSTKRNLLEMPVPDTLMQPSMEYQNLIM